MIAITTVTPTIVRCLSLVKVPRQVRRSLHFLTNSKRSSTVEYNRVGHSGTLFRASQMWYFPLDVAVSSGSMNPSSSTA